MTATKAEIRETKEDGVVFNLYLAPLEITSEGVIFIKTEKVIGEDGKETLRNIPGTEHLYPCDSVIIAVSQAPQNNIVANTTGLETRFGLLIADDEGRTTKEGVFASGDVVSGAKTVIEAVVHAKKVSETIDRYLQEKKA
jgi:glutamate synthase (NADPH/NADH) small chain